MSFFFFFFLLTGQNYKESSNYPHVEAIGFIYRGIKSVYQGGKEKSGALNYKGMIILANFAPSYNMYLYNSYK